MDTYAQTAAHMLIEILHKVIVKIVQGVLHLHGLEEVVVVMMDQQKIQYRAHAQEYVVQIQLTKHAALLPQIAYMAELAIQMEHFRT